VVGHSTAEKLEGEGNSSVQKHQNSKRKKRKRLEQLRKEDLELNFKKQLHQTGKKKGGGEFRSEPQLSQEAREIGKAEGRQTTGRTLLEPLGVRLFN